MTTRNPDEVARKRATIIMKVRNGEMTAKEGAKALGVSTKTYYEWEKRGLAGMMNALTNQEPGRRATETDPERQALEVRLKEVEELLADAQRTMALRQEVQEMEQLFGVTPEPKKKEVRRRRKR